jgi:adenine-specific DNA-methyltransferase
VSILNILELESTQVPKQVPDSSRNSLLELGNGDLSLVPPSKRELSNKKRNGVFYTPDLAAQLLVEWGIRSAMDTVLEPSFGGCGFLEAVIARLNLLGAPEPETQLFGCDIDTAAFSFLSNVLEEPANQANFKQIDFLSVKPNDFRIAGVDVVIGNPPYVSWHNMLPAQRASAKTTITPNGQLLNRKGSLWTFFVTHSLHFLNHGGRMAWILPGSFIYADYALPLREIISKHFSRSVAIVLCEGYQDGASAMHFALATGLLELKKILQEWSENQIVGVEWDQKINRIFTPAITLKKYDTICNTITCKKLATLMKTRIGLVTGDNQFFVLNKSKGESLQIPTKILQPIIGRHAHFRGLRVTSQDLTDLIEKDVRCLLLDTNIYKDQQPEVVDSYLKTYPIEEIRANRTFAKRKPWHRIAPEITPDAFFSCMNWYGPVLVLNPARTTCTNTVYRVNFEQSLFLANTPEHIAVSLQSTFSQLSAELVGRSYGSGALKLEPTEVGQIAVLLPRDDVNVSDVFAVIDAFMRNGQLSEARHTADQFLISQALLTEEDVKELEKGLLFLRKLRQGARKPVNQ